MEVKLKLNSWDEYDASYLWNGLIVFGYHKNSEEFSWFFPSIKPINTPHKSYVLKDYDIPRFGESYQKYFEKVAKEDLEEELTKLMKSSLNQQLLIDMLFNNKLKIGEV